MKKGLKWALGSAGAVALLWLLAFGGFEIANARLRGQRDNDVIAKPRWQGLYRLRAEEEESLGYLEDIPGLYFERYVDEDKDNRKSPKGWQPPGTVVIEDDYGSTDFSDDVGLGHFVRVVRINTPERRHVVTRSYFLGVIPAEDTQEGYYLHCRLGNGSFWRAHHTGETALAHSAVMLEESWYDGELKSVQTNFIRADMPNELAAALAGGEGFEALTLPLFADTPEEDILRLPSDIFFVE